MSRRGIVLSWEQGRAQVLDNEGAFVTIRSKHQLTVGEEINIPRAAPVYLRYVAAASVLFALLAGFAFDNMALAHVSVDMEKSVELGVNWRDKVVSVKALNTEAEELLTTTNPKGQSVSMAVKEIVAAALKNVPEDTEPMAVVTVSGKVKVENIKGTTEQAVQSALDNGKKVGHVIGVAVSEEIRAEAKDSGISPGQYALALKATEKGSEVTAKEIKANGLQQALQNAGADPKQVAEAAKNNGLGQVKQEVKNIVKGTPPGQQKTPPGLQKKQK